MANSQNLCLFTGNLGKDPEIRYSQSGAAVAEPFYSSVKSPKNGEQYEDHTEWVNLVAFGKRAEVIRDYTHKGSKIRVSTRVQTRKWQDQSGQDRYTTEFVIDDLELLTPKQEGQPAQQRQPEQRPGKASARAGTRSEGAFEDDIPF